VSRTPPEAIRVYDLTVHHISPRTEAVLAAIAPGVLAGVHVTGLILFLNADLPFDLVLLLRGIWLWAPPLSAISLVLHLPLIWRAPERVARVLPWSLTFVFMAAAVTDGYHASHLAFYLPSGINVRLIKAALWVGLAALVALFTALLHTLHDRRYGVRSQWLLGLLAAASLFAVVERREAYRPETEVLLRTAAAPSGTKRLVVAGIESATLDAVLPLAEQGILPFFAQLISEGSYARLPPLVPVRREPGWTSVMTGKYPFRHAIVDGVVHPTPGLGLGAELRLLPLGVGFDRWGTYGAGGRQLTRDDRQALAIWEILGRLGWSAGVVGWPTVTPTRSPISFALSERFFAGDGQAEYAVPADLALTAELFRVGIEELDPELLTAAGTPPDSAFSSALQQDIWRRTILSFVFGQNPVEATFLRMPGLGLVSRTSFGGYSAHQLAAVTDPELEAASRRLIAYYRFVDETLAELWRAGDSDPTLFVVVSSHGVSAPGWLSGRSARGRFDADADGVRLLRGEGVRAGTLAGKVEGVDVLPTILYALGLPVSRDLDGRVVTEFFDEQLLARRPMTFVPSYETLGAIPE